MFVLIQLDDRERANNILRQIARTYCTNVYVQGCVTCHCKFASLSNKSKGQSYAKVEFTKLHTHTCQQRGDGTNVLLKTGSKKPTFQFITITPDILVNESFITCCFFIIKTEYLEL